MKTGETYEVGGLKFKKIAHGRYMLLEDYTFQTNIRPKFEIRTAFLRLHPDGLFTLFERYLSDGASGPAWDSLYLMRGVFLHDGWYQLLRTNQLPALYRKMGDKIIRAVILEDGMVLVVEPEKNPVKRFFKEKFIKTRAWWFYKGLRWGGKSSAQ